MLPMHWVAGQAGAARSYSGGLCFQGEVAADAGARAVVIMLGLPMTRVLVIENVWMIFDVFVEGTGCNFGSQCLGHDSDNRVLLLQLGAMGGLVPGLSSVERVARLLTLFLGELAPENVKAWMTCDLACITVGILDFLARGRASTLFVQIVTLSFGADAERLGT